MKKGSAIILFGVFIALFGELTYGSHAQFRNFLRVSPFADADNWFLTGPLDYEIRDTGIVVTVPEGFVTDFASIPRPFWSVLPRWGKYGAPSVVHDFLYWDQRCTREQADRIVLTAMEESEVGPVWRFIIHRAVAWGGALAWKGNRDLRASGKTRQIPIGHIPTNPTIAWKTFQNELLADGVPPEVRPSLEPPPSYCIEIEKVRPSEQPSKDLLLTQ
jgi:hypothetical protein